MFARSIQKIRSLQWRLVLIFIFITVALMVSASISLNYFVESSYYETFKKIIENGFNNWYISENPTESEIEDSLKKNQNAIITFRVTDYKTYTVVNKASNKIVCSNDELFEQNKEKFLDEILKSRNYVSALGKTKVGENGKLTYLDERVFFDYAREKGDFILYFRYYREEWGGTIRKFNEVIQVSLFIAVIASLIFGYMLSKTITVPIVNLMHKVRKVAAGDFEQSLEVKSDDEIGKLTKSFNFMAKELKSKLSEISREKNKMETILNFMQDGVIAFNSKGEIIHKNPASKKMLGVEAFDFSFNDFSRHYSLGVTLEDILYLDSSTKEVSSNINHQFVRIYFATVTDEEGKVDGIITVIQDITEQQKLENMRKEFVANVSHELRTPLTSIKSYAETLIDGGLDDLETAEKFLKVINSEADRMTRLVKDLLQLSKLDNQQMKWNKQSINFTELVKMTVERMQITAKNKEQQLECFVIGDIPQIVADKDRIEQVVVNILSNAVKYTPTGGKISIYIGKLYNDVYVKVADSGIGIPKDDLERIFERFFRVDKARSRDMGGTGLGLAIAKEIVEAHQGTISVNSEFGKGTEVMVKLPICN